MSMFTLIFEYLLYARHHSRLCGGSIKQDRQYPCSWRAYIPSGNNFTMKTAELNHFSFPSMESSKMKETCMHIYAKGHSPVFARWFPKKLPLHKHILMHINVHSHTHTHYPLGLGMLLNYTLFFPITSARYKPTWPDWGSGHESRDLSLFEDFVRSLLQIRTYGHYFSVPKPGSDSGRIWIMASESCPTLYLLQKTTEMEDDYYRVRVCERWTLERFLDRRWVIFHFLYYLIYLRDSVIPRTFQSSDLLRLVRW